MTEAEHLNLVKETYVCPLCELADCFTSDSEDEPSVTDISDNILNSSSSSPDLSAETACDHELRLRGLNFDSLPTIVNTTNGIISNTQPGCILSLLGQSILNIRVWYVISLVRMCRGLFAVTCAMSGPIQSVLACQMRSLTFTVRLRNPSIV